MDQPELGVIIPSTKLDQFSREDLIRENQFLESELSRTIKEVYRLKYKDLTEAQLSMVLQEHLNELRQEVFGKSSERYKKPAAPAAPGPKAPPVPRVRRPSERYPNVVIREVPVKFETLPACEACGRQMSESGMTEDSEQLTMMPRKFEILKYQRAIYRCSCQGCMKTAPSLARMVPGSNYSDEMIMDVALSKYCDLIPIERYVQMAARSGVEGLPANGLIELTHAFASFVRPVYDLLQSEVRKSRVLAADETPHRMLEGSATKSWYLWGFSTPTTCYLQAHDTRSGDVASGVLRNSACEILISDAYGGYQKAIRITNQERIARGQKIIQNAICSAHARRNFFKIRTKYPEADFYLDHYHEIYRLESEVRGKPPDEIRHTRGRMRSHFAAMKDRAEAELDHYPLGKYKQALNYLLENEAGLTLCLQDPEIPLDNNAQERLLRSHVVGRKTWYGTHSEKGAETAAILFSVVESCKLNGVNPREYFPKLVQNLLQGKKPYTPKDYKDFA